MEKNVFAKILDSLSAEIDKDHLKLFEKIFDAEALENIKDFENFHELFKMNFDILSEELVKKFVCDNSNVTYLFRNFDFIEANFRYWITKIEGTTCCADKSKTLVRALINFYKTGKEINFNYDQEFTYHLPKKVFTTHTSIVEFYEGLKSFRRGNPDKYLSSLLSLATFRNTQNG